MKRYFRLIGSIYRFWLMRTLEFRVEVISWSIESTIWSIIAITTVELIFGQVQSIAGWGRPEVLLLVATQALFNSILWMFVNPSLLGLSEIIRDGNYDFVLTKPVSSRFLVTFRRFEFANYLRIIVMSFFIGYLIHTYNFPVNFWTICGYLLMIICGLLIFYSLFLIITTLNFWFVKISNLLDIFDMLVVIGRYPTYIFTKGAAFIFFFILPIAYVATLPVKVLLGKGSITDIALAIVMVIVFYIVSDKFWNYAQKVYSSASS